MKFRQTASIAAIAATALWAGAQRPFDAATKLHTSQYIIDSFYVDSINSDRIVEQGIIAMLKELDPHSVYTTAAETKALTEPLAGNFSGIGVQFQMVQDTVYVIQTVASGPSEKVGIIPGDRIIAANDTVIAGRKMANSAIMKHLRGPKGSIVNLKVVRRSEPDTLVFRVKRDDIPLYTVEASFMADPQTGYIRVSSFGEHTADEFADAYGKLKKSGMRNLIIDLQDNGGGYLKAAVDMATMFLAKGDTIVYTEGLRQSPGYFTASSSKPDLKGRIAVLTNEYSASAAEIMAGAMQDNDRGIIVGRRTFGKGLVQRPFPFPDGSMIRLTTARYYTPSGRSIQKPYAKGETDDYQMDLKRRYDHGEFYSADSIHLDKSREFHTRGGRKVYGGGGIMPDSFVAADTTGINRYFRELRAKNVINQFVVDYVETHRKELNREFPTEQRFIERFDVTPAMVDDFVELGRSLGVEPDAEQLQECRPFVEGNIKGLIGRDLFTPSTYYRVMNPLSPIYRKALELINNTEQYNALLHP
ncbi:MAG: S41 family peptidase [Muribaculaceae bacterium]|nr:S41 family peptidase [Muribaculaceae bacterium]